MIIIRSEKRKVYIEDALKWGCSLNTSELNYTILIIKVLLGSYFIVSHVFSGKLILNHKYYESLKITVKFQNFNA